MSNVARSPPRASDPHSLEIDLEKWITNKSASLDARLKARYTQLMTSTSGLAPGHVQANLIILPSHYALAFRQLCARNPVACPLLAQSYSIGCYDRFQSLIPGISEVFTHSIDIRTDIPRYNIYKEGELIESGCTDIKNYWTSDSVAFLIGCSFSFEDALARADLTPRHVEKGRNVSMYRTSIPLSASGVFTSGTYVVSMRPYKRKDIERVREITRLFTYTHGEPIAWGWDAVERLGIRDIDSIDYGDPPVTAAGQKLGEAHRASLHGSDEEGEVPVFWGCGVTPQEAVMKAGKNIKGIVVGHMPGCMLVTDLRADRIVLN